MNSLIVVGAFWFMILLFFGGYFITRNQTKKKKLYFDRYRTDSVLEDNIVDNLKLSYSTLSKEKKTAKTKFDLLLYTNEKGDLKSKILLMTIGVSIALLFFMGPLAFLIGPALTYVLIVMMYNKAVKSSREKLVNDLIQVSRRISIMSLTTTNTNALVEDIVEYKGISIMTRSIFSVVNDELKKGTIIEKAFLVIQEQIQDKNFDNFALQFVLASKKGVALTAVMGAFGEDLVDRKLADEEKEAKLHALKNQIKFFTIFPYVGYGIFQMVMSAQLESFMATTNGKITIYGLLWVMALGSVITNVIVKKVKLV